MRSTKTPSLNTAAAVLAVALLSVASGAAAAAGGKTLGGTWEVTATFVNCDTGAALSPSFPSLHTYLGTESGSMIEQGSRIGAPPTLDRSVAQGVWERVSGRRYRSLFKFFRFDVNGVYIGGNEINTTLDLGAKGNFFVAESVGVAFDAGGNLVPPVNCVHQTGTRKTFAD